MVSEIIPITAESAAGAAVTSKPLASPPPASTTIPLVLPQANTKPKPPKPRSSLSKATHIPHPLVLPPPASSDTAAEPAAKRPRAMSPPEPEYRPQHLRSNANSDDDDDDDDETPLAAQLAEVLAAQGAEEAAVRAASRRSSPTPLPPAGLPAPRVPSGSSRPLSAVAQLPAHSQQRRMSDIAQVRPELMGAPSQTVSSLVLPSKPISKSPVTPGVAFAGESPTGVAHHGPLRTPSPAASGAMTAKKSGYSSYWSVHERSAFMHYVARLGPDWAAIAEAIGSKTATQARNYFRTNREKLKLDVVLAEYKRNKAAGTVPPMAPY
ncbi:DNA-binding protein snt1, partial [Linderina pennispora]